MVTATWLDPTLRTPEHCLLISFRDNCMLIGEAPSECPNLSQLLEEATPILQFDGTPSAQEVSVELLRLLCQRAATRSS